MSAIKIESITLDHTPKREVDNNDLSNRSATSAELKAEPESRNN